MKCIRYNKSKEIKRVSDEQAQTAVGKGLAKYVAKKDWKIASRINTEQ